jgi:hypothetical protein
MFSNLFFEILVYGCNVLTNPQAITCANGATCNGSSCVCTSNNTVGTLCEIGMLDKDFKRIIVVI